MAEKTRSAACTADMEVASIASAISSYLKRRDDDVARHSLNAQGAASPNRSLSAGAWFGIIFGVVTALVALGMGMYVWVTGYFDVGPAFQAGSALKGILFILGNTFLPLYYNLYRAIVGGGVFPYRPLPVG